MSIWLKSLVPIQRSRGKSSSILLLPLADKDLGDFMEELDRDVPSQVDLLVKWTVCLVEGLRYIHSQHVKRKDNKIAESLGSWGEDSIHRFWHCT